MFNITVLWTEPEQCSDVAKEIKAASQANWSSC